MKKTGMVLLVIVAVTLTGCGKTMHVEGKLLGWHTDPEIVRARAELTRADKMVFNEPCDDNITVSETQPAIRSPWVVIVETIFGALKQLIGSAEIGNFEIDVREDCAE